MSAFNLHHTVYGVLSKGITSMNYPSHHLGFPVVTAANCFDTVRRLGIKAWPKKTENVPIVEWLKTATPE